MTTQRRTLYKSHHDKIIDGVCGGIAEYLAVDPTVVRIVWIVMTILGGAGVLLYIAGIIIIPKNTSVPEAPQSFTRDRTQLLGTTMIIIGGLLLLNNLDLIGWFDWDFSWKYMIPILFIVLGSWLLLFYSESKRRQIADETVDAASGAPMHTEPRVLYRHNTDKKLLGLCGGLAEYFDLDSSLVRLFAVLLLFASFGTALLFYFIFGAIIPRQPIPSTIIQ